MKTVNLIDDIEKEFNSRLKDKSISYTLINDFYSITNLISLDEQDIKNKNIFINYINIYYLILHEVIEDFYYKDIQEQKTTLNVFKKHYSIYFTNKLKSILIGSSQ